MSWKKSLPFFAWQSLRYAQNWVHFKQIWSCYGQWSASFRQGRNSVSDECAWITFPAQAYIEQHIRPDFRVFEFGGGGSTLFFCKKVAEVITVEDNAEWFEILSNIVQSKNYQHWQSFFVAPEPVLNGPARSHENPADFKSGSPNLGNLSFERYARTIDSFPEACFDLILVDGRARPSCIQQALPHLKTGGLLVIDNTERPYYLAPFSSLFETQFSTELHLRAPVPYTPDFTRTTILKKR